MPLFWADEEKNLLLVIIVDNPEGMALVSGVFGGFSLFVENRLDDVLALFSLPWVEQGGMMVVLAEFGRGEKPWWRGIQFVIVFSTMTHG